MPKMKFSHSVMFILLAAVVSFFLGVNYVKEGGEEGLPSVDVLLALDAEFSDYSKANGAYAAFAAYLADDAVALNGGQQPQIGRENIIATMTGYPEGAELVWTPMAGDISNSGDLGYTWGRYIYSAPGEDGTPQISHGKYMTVWKRQADGGWKAVLDGGNPNPPPEE